MWSPAFYDNQQDVHIANNDTSYLIPGVPHVRGSKLRNYTRLVHINNCGEFGYKIKVCKNERERMRMRVYTNAAFVRACVYV